MSAREMIESRLRSIGLPNVYVEGDTFIQKWDSALKKFSNAIEKDYIDNREPRADFEKKIEILEEIENYMARHVFNKSIEGDLYALKGVVPFGSSTSGLGMKGGDLDMTICVHPPIGRKRRAEIHSKSNDILRTIFASIKNIFPNRDVREMKHISEATVPIITGYVDGIELDISISMTFLVSAQYLSSKFIDAYGKYDHRFILLAAFVKKWQKSMKTGDNEGYYNRVIPNSCSTVLLVVFFMKHYGLLPNIYSKHKDILGYDVANWKRVNQGENGSFGIPDIDVQNWKLSNKCEVSVATLFLLFIDFYAEVVDLKSHKLDISKGKALLKGRKNAKNRIYIVDVIDKWNPCRSVTEIEKYMNVLRKAKIDVREELNISVLMKKMFTYPLFEVTTPRQSRTKTVPANPLCVEYEPVIHKTTSTTVRFSEGLLASTGNTMRTTESPINGKQGAEARLKALALFRGPHHNVTAIQACDSYLDKFSISIEQDYLEKKESEREWNKKKGIIEEVNAYLKKLFRTYPIGGIKYTLKAVVPFGSSASSLATKDGDLDMLVCLHLDNFTEDEELIKKRRNEILGVIFQDIQLGKCFDLFKNRTLKDMEHIRTARVPIITGFVDGVEIDISISMDRLVPAQYLAAKFVDAYEKYNAHFIPLAAFIKKWQKSMKTDENEQYHRMVFPSSCSTVLMVVFFMKHYGLLPNVNSKHSDKLEQNSATWPMAVHGEEGSFGIPNEYVRNWKTSNSYEISVGTLFLLFVDFYTNVINVREDKLDIRTGKTVPKTRAEVEEHCVVIVDVIDTDNPAKNVSVLRDYDDHLQEARQIIIEQPNSAAEKLLKMKLNKPSWFVDRVY
ncbi:unnamed protein product [Caenorhabditis sp. 36 PRJEB53466]|nr:unnamed protein product [Caenorhabditis sp. 36 PRJEB53466]